MLLQDGHQSWWPGDSPFEVIVGAILTQNTSWSNVEKAISNLKKNNVLKPHRLSALTLSSLKKFIRPSGFFNIKADRLKHFLVYFKSKFGFSIKKMKECDAKFLRRDLLSVKGIGKETADSILLYALEKKIFVVDAYTRRIFSRHGIFEKDLPYDDIQRFFQSHLPKSHDLFNDYHAQIVMIGKKYCKKRPDCLHCPLNFLFKIPGLRKTLQGY